MNKEILGEMKYEYEYNSVNHKVINLFYEFQKNIPKSPDYYINEFKKESIIYYIYDSILSYSKQSFYNLVLGNIELYKAGIRMLVENYIILLGIKNDNADKWKKYFLHSSATTLTMLKNNPKINLAFVENAFEKFKEEYDLKEIEYEDKKFNYSWLSTDNKKIKTFRDACDLLEPKVYEDFKLLSYTSHSNSYFSKFSGFDSSCYSSVMLHLLYLYKVVEILNFKQTNNYIKSHNDLVNYLDYLNKNDPFLN